MAPAPKKEDSVFDFLYVDARRIALFNSQFGEFGQLTNLSQTASTSEDTTGDINLHFVKGGTKSAAQRGLTRQFDAQWVAPLTFLDETNKKGMIVSKLEDARIGQLVLSEGDLSIRDVNIIKKAFALPSMRAQITGTPAEDKFKHSSAKRRDRESAQADPQKQIAEFAFDFLGQMPHAIHASLLVGDNEIWCSLKEDSLIVSANDVFLNHGVRLSGKWHILGILDAIPEEQSSLTPEKAAREMEVANTAMPHNPIDTVATLVNRGFGGLIDGIAPLVRLLLGRPSRSYGVTPVLIFREVLS